MIIDNDEENQRCEELQKLVREEILGETENIVTALRSNVSQETYNQINRPMPTIRSSFGRSPTTF